MITVFRQLLHFASRALYKPVAPWAWPLLPLEWGYGWVMRSRAAMYRWGWLPTVRLPVPVISVGNLTMGGTGKTPIVEALTQALLERGLKVVILSHGYRARKPQTYARATHPDYGDEAAELQQKLPQAMVIVGRKRSQTGVLAVAEYQPDVVLLDDGYQHLRLARDVNLLLVDGNRGLGNGRCVPIGPLREPIQCRQVSAVWVTKSKNPNIQCDLIKGDKAFAHVPYETIPFEPIHFQGQHGPVPLQALSGQTAVCVSGVDAPDFFETLLTELGVELRHRVQYPDHFNYQPDDVAQLLTLWSHSQAKVLITTEKDWVKLQHLLPAGVQDQVYRLSLKPRIPAALLDQLLPKSKGPNCASDPC
jgi:tetraacyldisaccharide 4'-kinase